MTGGRTTSTIGAVAARGVALTAAIGVAGLWSAPIAAQRAPPRRVAHDIPAGPLDVVLRRLAVETDEQILVDPALVAGRRAPPLARGLPVGAALDTALSGHPLAARRVGPGVLVIERVAAPDAGDWAATPADIVVTAERRPTLLSAAAPSLAVISAATLEETRTVERRALARLLPALTATNTGPLQQRLSVRGVIGTGEGTVGVYYGEVPVTAPSGTGFDPGAMTPDVDLIDVERIELLKGPQGTLYGASSLGGTLRTLFRQADAGGFAADGAVELGTTRGGGPSAALSAMVNVPVVADRLAVRVVAGRRRTGGVTDNVRLGYRDGDVVTRDSERIGVSWTPDPRWRVDAIVLEQRNRIDDAGTWRWEAGPQRTDVPVRLPNSDRLRLASATVRWAPGAVRVTATASHYAWRTLRQIDFTSVMAAQRDSIAACGRYAASVGGGACDLAAYRGWLSTRLPAVLYQPMTMRSTSAEARVSDDGNGAWRWTLGAFAEHRVDGVSSDAVRADAGSGRVIWPLDVTGLRLIDTRLDQQALYGEVTRELPAGLSATVGMRGYRYVRAAGGSVPLPNIATGTGNGASARYRTVATGSNLKAALAWRGAGGAVVQLSAAEGFRPGGVNITPELSDAERVYRADRLWNYELGMRVPVAGPTVGIESALFHIDWRDTIFVAASANGAFLYNTNLGGAHIDGAEARVTATHGALRLAAGATVLDARLSRDTPAASGDGAGLRGDPLPNVPTLTWVVSADLRRRAGGGTLTVGAVASGNGGFATTFSAQAAYREYTPARTLADVYALYRRGGWSARLGIDNVADAVAPARIVSSAFGVRQVYSARPRTVTLTLAREY